MQNDEKVAQIKKILVEIGKIGFDDSKIDDYVKAFDKIYADFDDNEKGKKDKFAKALGLKDKEGK